MPIVQPMRPIVYCEGAEKSPDYQLYHLLLKDVATVKPMGSKWGMHERIQLLRKETKLNCFGLCDRDFDHELDAPGEAPMTWQVNQNGTMVHIGWKPERKEIENYLIDAKIVERSFKARNKSLDLPRYQAALEAAARTLSFYTAARVVLDVSRKDFKYPSTHWRDEDQGKGGWRVPSMRDKQSCLAKLRGLIAPPANAHELIEARYEHYVEECTSGLRASHFLTYFAGKDLLYAMGDGLKEMGLNAGNLIEAVLNGIERSRNVWEWLPEWARLRSEVTVAQTKV